ncbi:MAG TPA: ATP-binding cassette domain-containing protein [Acidimicrobiales bacterium]|nr:ATP-binding cassette domain-containing protein [Acidimicrobiales bacterium]
MSLLEVDDLTVEYSSGGYRVTPLKGFNLQMDKRELGVLLGASGCGKSTLLSTIAGLLRPRSGSIRVKGSDVVGLKNQELTRYRQTSVGVVFQAFNLIPSLNARENVELICRTAGQSRTEARRRAEYLLEVVGLEDRMGHRPGMMSGGQQQRVAIARALALDPPVILADEPTAHLDYIQVEGVLKTLRQLADADRTVLIATHDERLLPLADRIIELSPRVGSHDSIAEHQHLDDGEILFEQGDPGSLVYMVDSGLIQLIRRRDDGSDEIISEASSGAYFGELAPMFGLPRSATARAVGPAVVTGLPLRDFRAQMSTSGPNP